VGLYKGDYTIEVKGKDMPRTGRWYGSWEGRHREAPLTTARGFVELVCEDGCEVHAKGALVNLEVRVRLVREVPSDKGKRRKIKIRTVAHWRNGVRQRLPR
jgi:hypothetical protein